VKDNPITAILKASNKNLVLINTIITDDFPYSQLPAIKEGEVIETTNPIVGELKIGNPFLKDYPLKVQTDALLYFGDMKSLRQELHTPFNDPDYEMELNRRKKLAGMN